MKATICLLIYSCFSYTLIAQIDTIPIINEDEGYDLIENYIQNNEIEGDFENQDVLENLEIYQRSPINLNKADYTELENLQLLQANQISALIAYRNRFGKLISLYELQAVPGFDLETIKTILPYVKVSSDLDDVQVPLGKMLIQGQNEIITRWTRVLEEKKGFSELTDGEEGSRYLGDENKLFFRFKHTNDKNLSYGITGEKDAGEEFFRGSNRQGFDFYSAHFFLKNYNKTIKAVVIGDYAPSFGQGLVLFSGFARRKGADVMSIRRGTSTLRGYSSVGEALFMRGAGVTLGFGDRMEWTVFGSSRKRDSNIITPEELEDIEDIDEDLLVSSSLQASGLHRTQAEIEDKNSNRQRTLGTSIKYKTNRFHLAFNALYNRLDKELQRSPRLYNTFYFNGDRLFNASIDYSYVYRNFNFFGETAMSDNGGLATTNGLLIGLDKAINLAVLHRHFEVDYQALNPSPFAETGNGANERGLYIGLQVVPAKNWTIQTYYDIFKFPYFRNNIDAPSKGYEYLFRLTYKERRKLEAYAQFRFEQKQRNAPDPEAIINYLTNVDNTRLRVHFSYNISPELTLKSRGEYVLFDNHFEPIEKGYMIYQDVIYKPKSLPFSFTTRYAVYDTDSYDARIYAYENSLTNEFLNPAYYNQGTRFYFNLKYRGIRGLTIEGRYARTFWETPEVFGSGLEEILGDTRSEIKLQVRYRFF